MQRSDKRILTTHVGRLQRPDDLTKMLVEKQAGRAVDVELLEKRLEEAVSETVRSQREVGLDIVNDGEFGRISWLVYGFGRLTGFELSPIPQDQNRTVIRGKDWQEFQDYYQYVSAEGGRTYYKSPGESGASGGVSGHEWRCVAPIQYRGHSAIQGEIDRLKSQRTADIADLFLTSTAPGDFTLAATNAFYQSDEEFLFAIADAMREEYLAITSAGIVLQIDDPIIPEQWDLMLARGAGEAEYRLFCESRIEALNYALRDIPEEMVRYHICWGSHHGPHSTDIPFHKIADLVLSVRASGIAFEAGNVRHEHEWKIWETVKLPDSKVLIPGAVSHATNLVEHPELVSQRIQQFCRLVGRERVIAGTDCGLGYRVHPQIAWAKLKALSEGAALASRELF